MSEEGLRMFLFLLQNGERKLTDSYIAVKQAHINDAIAEKTERVGVYGVIFTTRMDVDAVTENLKMKSDEGYLLIELTGNVDAESIIGFFPNTDIEELKSLNLEKNLKRNAEWLEKEREKAVEEENFERAAKIRDELEKKNDGKPFRTRYHR